MIPPLSIRLADPDAERVRQSVADAIQEIQSLPASGLRVIAHKLGRAPSWVGPSAIRGAITVGVVGEFRDRADRTQIVEIAATGYGATITIDLLVVP
jgi:hypothetical protein